MRCPYCSGGRLRCAAAGDLGRSVTECSACGRIIEERHSHAHPLFLLRAVDSPLPLVLPDLPSPPSAADAAAAADDGDDDPFLPTGFISAFSTFSLERHPLYARSSASTSGLLAELERALAAGSSSSSSSAANADPSGPLVSVDHVRAYLQIVDVASILRLDRDIADHAFELFKDCSSATCLRNRSVEALATAALVQAIREAQEPRTLQEISAASNLPQKEIGKYIKILGEALQLSQPLNSNSIAVHMPRFCTLLQLNKSAQELAAHIGEVVVNKCFCTRRNPISISAAAIYLACQLEDKRKTQAEICKVTGLTEVTLRKVYKELLENWDDLLPPNYTPATPPEKAFPTTTIHSGRPAKEMMASTNVIHHESQVEIKKLNRGGFDVPENDHPTFLKGDESRISSQCRPTVELDAREQKPAPFWQQQSTGIQGFNLNEVTCAPVDTEDVTGSSAKVRNSKGWMADVKGMMPSSADKFPGPWQLKGLSAAPGSASSQLTQQKLGLDFSAALVKGVGKRSGGEDAGDSHGKDVR